MRRANRRRRQLACHSIGDAATAAFLDAIESADDSLSRALRHRIEHGQLIRARDLKRIADLGVVVSAQPHAAADPEKDERLLGASRAARAYPFRSLLDGGVAVAFGSDYPGERTFAPLYGIHLAVNRAGDEAINPSRALRCYTAGGAHAEFGEHEKGRLAPGYLCDLVLLSDDPTRVQPESIADISVDATIVDGRIVYERVPLPGAETAPTRRAAAARDRPSVRA